MIIKTNLPDNFISKAVVSNLISKDIEKSLLRLGIEPLKLYGSMNCDVSVKHHPDLYFVNYCKNSFIFAKNICSIKGELDVNLTEVEYPLKDNYKYPDDVLLNVVFLGDKLICNKNYTHKDILSYASINLIDIIHVSQGYTKCNICLVDENSIITEDFGVAKVLVENNFNVLLLEKHAVNLPGYKYGFIGGASGKISADKIAFYGNIENHPEYNRIYNFLSQRGIEAISLSDEPLTDFGSLIPVL